MFLEDGEWSSAEQYCDKVLDVDPENAYAYLAKLMVEFHARNQKELLNCPQPFDHSNNYKKVFRFGDEKLKKTLISYLEQIDARNLEHIYCEATSVMTVAKGIDAYITAADLFKSISHYKDSQKLEAHCREKATAAARKANRKKRINSTLVLIVIIICHLFQGINIAVLGSKFLPLLPDCQRNRFCNSLCLFQIGSHHLNRHAHFFYICADEAMGKGYIQDSRLVFVVFDAF